MRILALDVGKRRIGIAVSDALRLTARPHSTIDRNRLAPQKIAAIAKDHEAGLVIVGLPLHLNGTEGEQAKDVRQFGERLAQALPETEIRFVDERLTTVEAQERLYDRRGGWRKNKDRIDAFAAASLLERFLNDQ
jgi:putative Holliday junction resolvase